MDQEEDEEDAVLPPPTSPASAAQREAVGQTHPGLRRENNEDAFAVHPGLGLFVVADAQGPGEVAGAGGDGPEADGTVGGGGGERAAVGAAITSR
jgi:hypothetical protein